MATASTSPSLEVREVARKVRGQPTSDGAGVRMTRVIGSQHLDSFDPFLLLDEFRSDDPNDYVAGFPDHPHRGFETVTYMLAGRMRHGDNQGNTGLLGPGSVQWMTAGRGMVGAAATQIARGELALTTPGATLPITAGAEGARLIVVGGRPLKEPVARYGPFVMNTVDELKQAFADYQSGRF